MGDADSLESNREFERKFLVRDDSILQGSVGERIRQGYVWQAAGWALRVRLVHAWRGEETGWQYAESSITLKGPRLGYSRPEFEEPLSEEVAEQIYGIAPLVVIKERHQPIVSEGRAWVVDVFHEANEGLMIAEYEGSHADVNQARAPWWCGPEVTFNTRYSNEALAKPRQA